MPAEYTFHPSENYIYVECFGELTIKEIFAYFNDLAIDTSIAKGTAEIVDLSKISYFNVTHLEAAQMPANYSPTQVKHEIEATILFGSNRINQGLTRLIEAYFKKSMPEHFFVVVNTHTQAIEKLRLFRKSNSVHRA